MASLAALEKLNALESNRLLGLERIVAKTKISFIECGEALAEIRDKRLYRGEFASFEDYCQTRWGFSRQRASTLIGASEVAQTVNQLVDSPLNESQARAMASVAPARRREVVERAQGNGKPLTARAIADAAKEEPKNYQLDKTGTVIPEAILGEWKRAEEWSEQIRQLSQIKCALENGLEAKDSILSELTNLTVANLINVGTDLKCILPYAVCWTCAGHKPARCSVCKGRGFVSKFRWDSIAPSEIKELRKGKR